MSERSERTGRILREARLRMGYSQQKITILLSIHIKQYQCFEYGERDIQSTVA